MEDKQKLLLGITNLVCLAHIFALERFTGIHNQATHNLTNTLLPEIIDYIDSIIELMSGDRTSWIRYIKTYHSINERIKANTSSVGS